MYKLHNTRMPISKRILRYLHMVKARLPTITLSLFFLLSVDWGVDKKYICIWNSHNGQGSNCCTHTSMIHYEKKINTPKRFSKRYKKEQLNQCIKYGCNIHVSPMEFRRTCIMISTSYREFSVKLWLVRQHATRLSTNTTQLSRTCLVFYLCCKL